LLGLKLTSETRALTHFVLGFLAAEQFNVTIFALIGIVGNLTRLSKHEKYEILDVWKITLQKVMSAFISYTPDATRL
jgi:hypothetical protein